MPRAVLIFILSLFAPSFIYAASQKSISSNQTFSHSMLIAQNSTISSTQAIQIAKQGKDLKALKVSRQRIGEREVYRVKLISNKGLVRVVLVDAYSGDLLRGK